MAVTRLMQASNSGSRQKVHRDRFKDLPGEIQDQILAHVLCDFPRPETTDPANDGKYIGEHTKLAFIPWRIDTRILGYPDEEVRARARRVMLTKNRFVCIRSQTVNLRPIFHAAQIPIVTARLGEYVWPGLEELTGYIILTHEIERLGYSSSRSSMTSTAKPWGRAHYSLEKLRLTVHGRPQLQEFVILRRDLALLCRALDGADSGYHRFGQCTRHTIILHGPFTEILTEEPPILQPSRFLQPYLDILRGFENFTIQGEIEPALAEEFEATVETQIEPPRLDDVLEDLDCQMSKADELLNLDRPIQAAHTYARASQELLWLYSKGILPRAADSVPFKELAEWFFKLDMLQAEAWLAVMQKRHDAAEDANPNRHHDAQSRNGQVDEDCGDPTAYSSLVDLVYRTVVRRIPPPLELLPSPHQSAMQLYYLVKADRLGDCGSMYTWENINQALRMAPDNDNIRREAELIRKRMTPWSLRWIPE